MLVNFEMASSSKRVAFTPYKPPSAPPPHDTGLNRSYEDTLRVSYNRLLAHEAKAENKEVREGGQESVW